MSRLIEWADGRACGRHCAPIANSSSINLKRAHLKARLIKNIFRRYDLRLRSSGYDASYDMELNAGERAARGRRPKTRGVARALFACILASQRQKVSLHLKRVAATLNTFFFQRIASRDSHNSQCILHIRLRIASVDLKKLIDRIKKQRFLNAKCSSIVSLNFDVKEAFFHAFFK